MPVDAQGNWSPALFPRQLVGLRATLPGPKNKVLFCGPRKSTKTWGCAHAVANHAWNTPNANICVLTVTQSVGVDSGVWEKLTDIFLPEWISGDFGMHWIRKPFVQGVTKKPTCILGNKFGNKSKISLESLRTESEVEARFKGKEYSMIWVNELTKFKARKTFDTLKDCLRGNAELKPDEYLFLADCNPDLDIGTESWVYKLWYELRNDDKCDPALELIRDSLELVEFTVDDNLSMTPQDKALLLSEYAHDQSLVDAYYYGKWVTASADAIFFKVFRPLEHVIGEVETASNPDPEMMFPEENCIELHTGWDPGPVNCAGVVAEAPLLESGKPTIKVLDELVVVGGEVDLQWFVETMLEKMDYWERSLGRRVHWIHHSDQSVFDQKDIQSKKYYHELIFDMSGGKIELIATERGPGTLPAGIDLIKMLFWSNRVHINQNKCPKLIDAFKSIRRGRRQGEYIAKGSIHKHPFDAFRYVVQPVCYEEIRWKIMNNIRRKSESSLVTVPV